MKSGKEVKIIIGTRGSALALWQSDYIRQQLCQRVPQLKVELLRIETRGDQTQQRGDPLPEVGGKGLFTAELEAALLSGTIDLAVHSLKDLPTAVDARFMLAAIPKRGPYADVLVSREGLSLTDLPAASCVGTSSIRRSAQLLRLRPDLTIQSIRGNVDTRIGKVRNASQPYAATILAQAGIERLGKGEEITSIFSPNEMLPAPGQGALAVQTLASREDLLRLLAPLHHQQSAAEVGAERAFLHRLNAGCNTPVGALARAVGDRVDLIGRCLAADGSQCIEVYGEGALSEADQIGTALAEQAIKKGADALLSR